MSKVITRKGKKFLVHEEELYTNNLGEIEWHVHLEGGWNSVWAKNRTIALAKAKREYGRLGVTGVSVMTPEKEKALLSNFW